MWLQSRLTLYDTMNYSPCQASLSLRILQERILKWLAIPTPGDLSNPGIEPESLMSSMLAGRFFTTSTIWEAPILHYPPCFFWSQMPALSPKVICIPKFSRSSAHCCLILSLDKSLRLISIHVIFILFQYCANML